MHDLSLAGPVDWMEFKSPDDGQFLRVNLSFLASNWKCLYGQGCPGMFPKRSAHTVPDLGCCTGSFYLADKDEYAEIDKRVKMLTPEDWDTDLHDEVYRHGHREWATKNHAKGRVVDGGCIFANRADGSVGSTGKTGCAFLHLGNRLNEGKSDLFDNSGEHVSYMPKVCWQLPIYTFYDHDDFLVVTAWSNDQWTQHAPRDEDGTSSSHHHWWCVDGPDNYINDKPLYVSMERELRQIVGDKSYEIIRKSLAGSSMVYPMPASPDGRTVIAVLKMPLPAYETIYTQVAGRTPKRPMP